MYICSQTQREHTSQLTAIVQEYVASTSGGGVGGGKKGGGGIGGGKRTSSVMKSLESGIISGGDGLEEGVGGRSEAHVYVDAHSYIYLEIELHKPLIAKRPISALTERYCSSFPPSLPPLTLPSLTGLQSTSLPAHQSLGEWAEQRKQFRTSTPKLHPLPKPSCRNTGTDRHISLHCIL